MLKRTGMLVLVLILCGAVMASAAEEQKYHLKLNSDMEYTHPQTLGIEYFGKLLQEQSGGRITFDLFYGGQLGTNAEVTEQVASGLVDAHATVTLLVALYSPSMAVFDLPYIFENEEVALKCMESDIFQAECDKLAGTGIKIIGTQKLGFRNVTNTVRPIRTPEDMKGIKIRVMENPVMIAMFEEVGAIPTPMALSELYTALQQGTVEGQENPHFVTLSNNFDEVCPYITSTEHTYSMLCLAFNEKLFNSMSPEDQALVLKCAADARDWQVALAKEREAEAVQKLKDRGHSEIITEIDKGPWIEAMRRCYPKFYDTIGKELIEKVMAFNEANK